MQKTDNNTAPTWAKNVLSAAAIYNLAWGAAVIVAPLAIFRWAGMMTDQVAWILDHDHDRRMTRQNGRDSLALGVAADELAHSSQPEALKC